MTAARACGSCRQLVLVFRLQGEHCYAEVESSRTSASRQLVYPYVVCGETTINRTVNVTHHHHASLLKCAPRCTGGAHTALLHGRGARAAPHRRSAHSELVVLCSNAEHKIVLALARTSLALEAALAARALVEEIL